MLLCLGGNKFGVIFPGPSVIVLCGWWSKIDVSLGITYASEVFKVLLCVIFV